MLLSLYLHLCCTLPDARLYSLRLSVVVQEEQLTMPKLEFGNSLMHMSPYVPEKELKREMQARSRASHTEQRLAHAAKRLLASQRMHSTH